MSWAHKLNEDNGSRQASAYEKLNKTIMVDRDTNAEEYGGNHPIDVNINNK